jgi:hypothetical protein
VTSTPSHVLAHYADLEARFAIVEDEALGRLVVPNGNGERPFHRWFHQKEAFSSDLLDAVLRRWRGGRGGGTFLDPFVGSGTSVIAAAQVDDAGDARFARCLGIEANPFLHFVAETKLHAMAIGAPALERIAGAAIRAVQRDSIQPAKIPGLSTFSNSTYFEPQALRQLLQLRAAIERAKADRGSTNVALLSLAACLEPVSGLRRDGRALRFEPEKTRADVLKSFKERIAVALADLKSPHAIGQASVVRGDGRRPSDSLATDATISVALFSPPYLNNIDYTEVYKLEAWFLGFYRTQGDFRLQRLTTVRSHPSVRFPEGYGASANGHSEEFDSLIAPLLASIPNDRYRVWRPALFRGYFDDMLETLVRLRSRMEPDGLVVYVVGNSLHGGSGPQLLVASDLLMARLAEMAGFSVAEIVVGRRPRRRNGGLLLRESLVALRPASSAP